MALRHPRLASDACCGFPQVVGHRTACGPPFAIPGLPRGSDQRTNPPPTSIAGTHRVSRPRSPHVRTRHPKHPTPHCQPGRGAAGAPATNLRRKSNPSMRCTPPRSSTGTSSTAENPYASRSPRTRDPSFPGFGRAGKSLCAGPTSLTQGTRSHDYGGRPASANTARGRRLPGHRAQVRPAIQSDLDAPIRRAHSCPHHRVIRGG